MLKTVGNPSTRYGDQTIINGNLVIGTSGKGIDFSADSHAAGMTSELLNDYEEGTWTPSVSGGAINGTSLTYTGTYTKIGRLVFINLKITSSTNNLQVPSYVSFSGLPFSVFNGSSGVVTTEDIDLTVANGFTQMGNTTMTLGACGSAVSTNTMFVTVTGYV